ncbi:MAG: TetR/AcrR family transcriptional regulator [Gammaproteobacteria bacterium]|nr:TetR/AcrR family transcriptional regulator [Gammaproteobacteria bacterium]
MNGKTTREQIIEAADRLFYQQGFEHTSFADISQAVNISRGNFYYHFKSKDEILDAVIKLRFLRTQTLLNTWEKHNQHPLERIRSFVNILIMNQNKIISYGCPVGTLCSELNKLNHSAEADANKLFDLFRQWLGQQFILLGHVDTADELALHVLAFSQGVATLANAFSDEIFVQREVNNMGKWLDSLTIETQHNHIFV